MATPRDIRRLAFQTLYQLDARPGDAAVIKGSLENAEDFSPGERAKAFALAEAAHAQRSACDRELEILAPTWPARRQAAVDRAILRLAHYEMCSGITPAKVAVNEAVELAKSFSTEKSPSFINGLLDKVLKRVLAERASDAPTAENDLTAADPNSAEPAAADAAIDNSVPTPNVQPRSGDQNVEDPPRRVARGVSPG